jgi:hypothetical protein
MRDFPLHFETGCSRAISTGWSGRSKGCSQRPAKQANDRYRLTEGFMGLNEEVIALLADEKSQPLENQPECLMK